MDCGEGKRADLENEQDHGTALRAQLRLRLENKI